MNQELSIALGYLGGQALRLGFGWAMKSIGAKKMQPFDSGQLQSIAIAALGSPAAPAIMQNAPILAQLSPEAQLVVAIGAGALTQTFARDTEKAVKKIKQQSTTHRINDRDDSI